MFDGGVIERDRVKKKRLVKVSEIKVCFRKESCYKESIKISRFNERKMAIFFSINYIIKLYPDCFS